MMSSIKAETDVKSVSKQKDRLLQKLKSVFERPDLILVVEKEELYVTKSELMEKSPVFKAMFSAPFKEKDAHRIELPGKNMKDFLIFLRCLLSGINEKIEMSNVFTVVPLAHEYQVESILSEAQILLTSYYKKCGFSSIKSQQIVNEILFAETYQLNEFLKILIEFASRKLLRLFSQATGYDKISHNVLHAISMKRWEDNIVPQSGESYIFAFGTSASIS